MCQSTCPLPQVREQQQQDPVPHQRGHVVEQLPNDYTPNNRDVICGRSKSYYHHVGNQNFRQLAASKISDYLLAKTKIDKGYVIVSILDAIQHQGGTFVRPDPRTLGGWWIVNDATAREKIGSTIRAIVRTMGGEDVVLAKLLKTTTQHKKTEHHHDDESVIPHHETPSPNVSHHYRQHHHHHHQEQKDELTLSRNESIASDNTEPSTSYSTDVGTHDHDESLMNCCDGVHENETDCSLEHQNLYEDPLFDWIPSSIVSVAAPTKRRRSVSLESLPFDVVAGAKQQPVQWISLDIDLDQSELNRLLNGVDIITEHDEKGWSVVMGW